MDAQGFPQGCPGLENYNSRTVTKWSSRPIVWITTQYGRRWAWQDCGKETHAEPRTDRPLHEHVEEFARNQTAWLDAFIPAMEKYMESGYGPHELAPVYRV